jgi:thioredoxin reductase (NADPH)
VHRRDKFRAEKIMQDKLMKRVADGKIGLILDAVVDEVLGDHTGVTGVRVRELKGNAKRDLAAKGLFVAIGHTPNTQLFKDDITIDVDGYIVTKPGSTATNVPGVFAAGDVQDKIFRQAVTAAGTGCMAAIEAEKFLVHHASDATLTAAE